MLRAVVPQRLPCRQVLPFRTVAALLAGTDDFDCAEFNLPCNENQCQVGRPTYSRHRSRLAVTVLADCLALPCGLTLFGHVCVGGAGWADFDQL